MHHHHHLLKKNQQEKYKILFVEQQYIKNVCLIIITTINTVQELKLKIFDSGRFKP